ncbi:MAG: cation transporter substrate-binding protein, partial [Frankiales bacterium]|nr:cation transporter substrate-binding protein [Frankiales bacterium]
AAENFYGDLTTQIGGSKVAVVSILTNPEADPHLFEPGTRNALAISQARIVIRNGAGYDDWIDKLLDAAPSAGRAVVDVSGIVNVPGEDPNPHVWYAVPKLPDIVRGIGDALIAADPANEQLYRDGVTAVINSLVPLQTAVAALGSEHPGAPVAYTERVPGLLLDAAQLHVLTPPSFARAIENGSEPSPADVAAMEKLLTTHAIKALLYNEQAASPLTARLKSVAASAGVPVVPVTETLPDGQTFQQWQLAQVEALRSALSR